MVDKLHYITKIEISKLWGEFDIEWNLDSDVNILSGANGSGKSTVLDCACALLYSGMIPKDIATLDKIKITFNNHKFIFFERGVIEDTIKNIEIKAKDSVMYKEMLTYLKDKTGKKFNAIKSFKAETFVSSLDNTSLDPNQITESELESLNLDTISTFDTAIIDTKAVKKISDDKVRTELDLEIFNLQKEYLNYQLNLSRRKDQLVNESSNIKEDIINLNKPHQLFLEIIDNLFKKTGKSIDRDKNEISFLLNKKEINVCQLSSGEKQLIIILLTVLLQDNKNSILFMDEPEISLHIDWQKYLLEYMVKLNPNVQIITATHSPGLVMNGWVDKVNEMSDIIMHKNKG